MSPLLSEINKSRDIIRTQRGEQMRRVARVSEVHPQDPYLNGSYYERWLILRMNFFGIKTDDCADVLELEKKYSRLLY